MSERKKRSIADPHVTEERSIDIFKGYLGLPDWIVRKEERDYHIDYAVELGANGNPDGSRFLIQLKGKKKLASKSEFATCSIKEEHLVYYSDKCRLPVYLLLADINTKQVYYLFMQEWIKKTGKRYDPNSSKKIQVKIPREQNLENISEFRSSVENSFSYVNELYPGSVTASIEFERRKLEQLDPNFRYDLSFTDNGKTKHVTLLPKEGKESTLKFIIQGAKNVEKMRQHIELGKPLKLFGKDITATGSKLFQDKEKLVLESESKSAGIELQILPDTTGKHTRPVTMIGNLYPGQIGFTVNASFHGLIEMQINTMLSRNAQIKVNCEKFDFNLGNWVGEKVNRLPYFYQVKELAEILQQGRIINYEIYFNGSSLLKGQISLSNHSEVEELTQCFTCRVLDAVRIVCVHCNINPDCPDIYSLSDDEINWWIEAASLIQNDSIKRSGNGLRLTGTLTDRKIELEGKPLFRLKTEYEYNSFCGPISLGNAEMILEGCTAERLTHEQKAEHDFIVTGQTNSSITTRLL